MMSFGCKKHDKERIIYFWKNIFKTKLPQIVRLVASAASLFELVSLQCVHSLIAIYRATPIDPSIPYRCVTSLLTGWPLTEQNERWLQPHQATAGEDQPRSNGTEVHQTGHTMYNKRTRSCIISLCISPTASANCTCPAVRGYPECLTNDCASIRLCPPPPVWERWMEGSKFSITLGGKHSSHHGYISISKRSTHIVRSNAIEIDATSAMGSASCLLHSHTHTWTPWSRPARGRSKLRPLL